MAVFQPWMVPEVNQAFWAALARGEFLTDAAAVVGTHRWRGLKWVRAAGGVRPRRGRDLAGRCVTFAEREEIALARAGGESMRSIARRLGRSPSTVSRELARNADPRGCYRATAAHALAYERASRPKPASCVRSSRRTFSTGTLRSRSLAGCGSDSPPSRRCGCLLRRSTSRCMSPPAGRCAAS